MAFFAKVRLIAAAACAQPADAASRRRPRAATAPLASSSGRRSSRKEARAAGVGNKGLAALAGARYATATIRADRAVHKAFSGSVEAFMKRRGATTIISKGRSLKKSNAALFNKIESTYGVSPGVLLAIWGMETGFGSFMGKQNTVSAIVTLAYDCRRPEFFTPHAIAALRLVDRGALSAGVGRRHAWRDRPHPVPARQRPEIWRRQQEPARQGTALTSTANFLRAMAGSGRAPGQYGRDRRLEFGERLSAGHRHHGRRHRRRLS